MLSWSKKTDCAVAMGSEALLPALEAGLATMKAGEQALIRIQPHARGTAEEYSLPDGVAEDAVLVYDVTLTSFETPPPVWKLKGHERLEWASKRKAEGNELFKKGKNERARKKYQSGIGYLESEYETTEQQRQEAQDLKTTLHLNVAAVDIKRGMWDEVIKSCTRVLKVAPQNTKALLRQGKAYNELNELLEAKRSLQAVLDQDGAPEVADARKEMAKVSKKVKAQDDKDRKAFGGMFSRVNLEKKEEPKETQVDIVPEVVTDSDEPPEGAQEPDGNLYFTEA
uniref:peptidylprolyl isomerase n=1 Tax=Eutreptiella gymnastica TaxID=73025 RepID=A0A7S1HXC2_9EUGL|mmetsp:Transcript_11247/g.20253  ORF Transcript_11247/g.20253 Transcript_11247/m.20253 type:complete len:283 (+) Transcript_11247:196-1044(+)